MVRCMPTVAPRQFFLNRPFSAPFGRGLFGGNASDPFFPLLAESEAKESYYAGVGASSGQGRPSGDEPKVPCGQRKGLHSHSGVGLNRQPSLAGPPPPRLQADCKLVNLFPSICAIGQGVGMPGVSNHAMPRRCGAVVQWQATHAGMYLRTEYPCRTDPKRPRSSAIPPPPPPS